MNNSQQTSQRQVIILVALILIFAAVTWFMFLRGDSTEPVPAPTPNVPGQAEPQQPDATQPPAEPGEKAANKPRRDRDRQPDSSGPQDDTFPGSEPVNVTRNPFTGTGATTSPSAP